MSKLKQLSDSGIFTVLLSLDKTTVELREACDGYHFVDLNKADLGGVIKELTDVHEKMIEVDTTEPQETEAEEFEMVERPKIGDYALAAKYDDDDNLYFYTGYILGVIDDDQFIIDSDKEKGARVDGLTWAVKMSLEEGKKLDLMVNAFRDRADLSPWDHLQRIRYKRLEDLKRKVNRE